MTTAHQIAVKCREKLPGERFAVSANGASVGQWMGEHGWRPVYEQLIGGMGWAWVGGTEVLVNGKRTEYHWQEVDA
jgi:hypothetical protein